MWTIGALLLSSLLQFVSAWRCCNLDMIAISFHDMDDVAPSSWDLLSRMDYFWEVRLDCLGNTAIPPIDMHTHDGILYHNLWTHSQSVNPQTSIGGWSGMVQLKAHFHQSQAIRDAGDMWMSSGGFGGAVAVVSEETTVDRMMVRDCVLFWLVLIFTNEFFTKCGQMWDPWLPCQREVNF